MKEEEKEEEEEMEAMQALEALQALESLVQEALQEEEAVRARVAAQEAMVEAVEEM